MKGVRHSPTLPYVRSSYDCEWPPPVTYDWPRSSSQLQYYRARYAEIVLCRGVCGKTCFTIAFACLFIFVHNCVATLNNIMGFLSSRWAWLTLRNSNYTQSAASEIWSSLFPCFLLLKLLLFSVHDANFVLEVQGHGITFEDFSWLVVCIPLLYMFSFSSSDVSWW